MKGLEAYLNKHGKHFTEELASVVTMCKWDSFKVMEEAQRHVYYNVTDSTVGDFVYLVNKTYNDGILRSNTKRNCVCSVLCVVGSYDNGRDAAFSDWLEDVVDFDFTPYI